MVEKQKENAGIFFILLHKNSILYHVTLESIVFWKFLCLQIFFTDEESFFIEETNLPNTSISLLQSEILSIIARLGAGADKERGR